MKFLIVDGSVVFEETVSLNIQLQRIPSDFVLCRTGTHMAVFARGEQNKIIKFPYAKDDVVLFSRSKTNEKQVYVVKNAELKKEGDEYFVETTFVLQGD